MGIAFTSRHVLVTRPEPGLIATMAEVTAQGWHALASPVMEIIHKAPSPLFSAQNFQAIAITSVQSLPFLRDCPKDILLLTVGKKTAERARRAGFKNICAADGNAASLISLCKERSLTGDRLVLASGTGWDGRVYGEDIIEALGIKRVESYKVKRMTRLNRVIGHSLLEGRVEAVLFYSSETVASFISLCSEEHLRALKGCRALCFSDAIAKKAVSLASWRDIGLVDELGTYHLIGAERSCILHSFVKQEQKKDVPESMIKLPCYLQGGGDCNTRGCLGFLKEIYS